MFNMYAKHIHVYISKIVNLYTLENTFTSYTGHNTINQSKFL